MDSKLAVQVRLDFLDPDHVTVHLEREASTNQQSLATERVGYLALWEKFFTQEDLILPEPEKPSKPVVPTPEFSIPDSLPEDLTCKNLRELSEQLLEAYKVESSQKQLAHIKYLVFELKKFSLQCEGYEQPSRYSDYGQYPVFYHPCTQDGEVKSTRFNKGSIAWETPENQGFFSYTGDWQAENPDITITDFTWPVSGDLRFSVMSKMFPHAEYKLLDV